MAIKLSTFFSDSLVLKHLSKVRPGRASISFNFLIIVLEQSSCLRELSVASAFKSFIWVPEQTNSTNLRLPEMGSKEEIGVFSQLR